MGRAKKEPIPKHFHTLEAAGDFWDTHDLGEYWDQTEEVATSFLLKRKRHFLAIEPGLARRLHAAAEARGVSPETIANLWLREMLGKYASPPNEKAPLVLRPDKPPLDGDAPALPSPAHQPILRRQRLGTWWVMPPR